MTTSTRAEARFDRYIILSSIYTTQDIKIYDYSSFRPGMTSCLPDEIVLEQGRGSLLEPLLNICLLRSIYTTKNDLPIAFAFPLME